LISKISLIDDMGVFNHFDWDTSVTDKVGNPLRFQKINILYGRNYSGKTTLSRIIRSLETKQIPEKYDNPTYSLLLDGEIIVTQNSLAGFPSEVRVFNEDFVRSNLRFLVDEEQEIEPFAILGAANTETEKSIRQLEEELGCNVEDQETGLYRKLMDDQGDESNAKKAFKDADRNLENQLSEKATHRERGIKYEPERYGDQNYTIIKLNKDISTVLSPDYSSLSPEQKAGAEQAVQEQEKESIFPLIYPALELESVNEKVCELLSREIGVSNKIAELLRSSALNQWVKKGQELHKGEDVCAFCGNPISQARWGEINAHFDDESRALESAIDSVLTQLNLRRSMISQALPDKSSFYMEFHSRLDIIVAGMANEVQAVKNYIESATNLLSHRKSQITMALPSNLTVPSCESLRNLYMKMNALIDDSNNHTNCLSDKKTSAQDALRLHEVASFCDSISYKTQKNRINELEQAYSNAQGKAQETHDNIDAKKRLLEALYRQLNDEEEGAKRVNHYLNDFFGHNHLSLEANEGATAEKRIQFRIMRDGKPAFNLSEGECSLIAFCYFAAKLDDVKTAESKPIIWIDDPISSLDSNHIYFVYSLIYSAIVKGDVFKQLFISTHNLDFLKYLNRLKSFRYDANGKAIAEGKANFLVEREGGLSHIIKMPSYLKEKATEFNYLFSVIYKCSKQNSISDENIDLLYSFGNCARRFFELYLYFRYPDESEEVEPKIMRFYGDDEVAAILTCRMINEHSHGTSLEKGSRSSIDPETITVAKRIIEQLSKDSDQFHSLLKSIDEAT